MNQEPMQQGKSCSTDNISLHLKIAMERKN